MPNSSSGKMRLFIGYKDNCEGLKDDYLSFAKFSQTYIFLLERDINKDKDILKGACTRNENFSESYFYTE